MYLFFKQDGSIEKSIINEYVMQGSSGVNYIYVYFTGRARATYLATAFITLPDTDVIELAMSDNTFVYDGVEYAGYRVALDGSCTSQGGEISINVTLTDVDENVLATHTFVKTVNATSVSPTSEISYAQYMALISMIFTMKSYNLGILTSLDSLDTEIGLGTYTFDYLEQAYYMFVSKDDDDNIIQTYITANAGAIVIKSREYDIVEETWGEWSTAQESNLIDATAATITSRAQLASVVANVGKLYIITVDIDSDPDFDGLSGYSAYLGENRCITLCGNGTIYKVDATPTYSTINRSASKTELSAEIAKIVNGTTIALKASQDEHGNVIDTTYGNYLAFAYDSATRVLTINLYSKDETLLDTKTATIALSSGTVAGLMSSAHYTKLTALPTNAELVALLDLKADQDDLESEVSRAELAEGELDTAKADKATTLSGYGITDAYTKTEVNNLVSSVYKYKGSVDTFDDLPTESLTIGDVYNVVDSGINFAWNGSAWDDIGGIEALATLTNDGLMSKEDFGKLQDLYTKAQLDTKFGDKADKATTYTKDEVDAIVDAQYPIEITDVAFANVGKNLFDKSKASSVGVGLVIATGATGSYANQQTSDYIAVLPETAYCRTSRKDNDTDNLGDDAYKVCYYDADKVFISGGQSTPTGTPPSVPITTPANCYFIRTTWNTTKLLADNVQLELGTTPTAYEAYAILIQPEYVENPVERVNALEEDTTRADGEVIKPVTNLIAGGNFIGTSHWTAINGAKSVASNVLSLVGDGTNANPTIQSNTAVALAENEKVYFRLKVRVTNAFCTRINVYCLGGYYHMYINSPVENQWYTISCVANANAAYSSALIKIAQEYADAETANGKTLEVSNVVAIRLKDDFGLGVNPDLHLVDKIFVYNDIDYINGTEDLIVKNNLTDVNDEIAKQADKVETPKSYHEKRRPIVTFVCDDGWEADYTKLKGFSETYGIPFVSALMSVGYNIKHEHMLELQNDLGWEVASHSESHVDMSLLETEAEIEDELKNSKDQLTAMGFNVYNLVYPYGGNDERVRRLAKKYYNCAATTSVAVNTGIVPNFYLKRVPLGSFYSVGTLESYKAYVDEAIANNGWLIFMLHPNNEQHDETQQAHIEALIQYIQAEEVEVMTLNDGFKVFGNALESGDYIGSTDGLAIAKNGNISLPQLILGETSSTAYRGDRGKTAFDHSQIVSGNPHQVSKSDVGLGNVPNLNAYGNIAVSDNLDAIVFTGFYTCYGSATGAPNVDYSWFIVHLNSGVGATYAKQIAFAYDGKIYERFKDTTWSSWVVLGSGNGTGWIDMTLETGWSAVENYTPQYKVFPYGVIFIRGRVLRGTGGSSTITIMPAGLRPSQPTDYINSSNSGGSLVVMSINSSGSITSSATEGVVVELNYSYAL